jgi:hypothetical protein
MTWRAVPSRPCSPTSTTRTMPRSQPWTAEGRRYPSTHRASIRGALTRPTALLSPFRQNAAERTMARRKRRRKGAAA